MSLRCAAVVLAGGSGSRMGGNTPKQYLLLDGKPLIWYSLHAFEESPVEEVVLVVRPGETELCRRNLVEPFGFRKIRTVVEGGKERFHSVFAGLQALKGRGYDLVAIHDGARPMVSQEVIARTFQAAEEYGLKILDNHLQDNKYNSTRFIVISKKLYIDDNANKVSLCFCLPHESGSLYDMLGRFNSLGLNLTKIESRPIPGKSFEYLFYLDFSGSVRNEGVTELMCSLSEEMPEFSFLGNYSETPAF